MKLETDCSVGSACNSVASWYISISLVKLWKGCYNVVRCELNTSSLTFKCGFPPRVGITTNFCTTQSPLFLPKNILPSLHSRYDDDAAGCVFVGLSRLLMTSPAVEPRLSINLFPLLLFTTGPAVVLPRRIYWPLLAGTCSPFKAGACWHEGYIPSCHNFSTTRLLRLCCTSLLCVNNGEWSKLVCLWDESGGGSQCWLDCWWKQSERAGPGSAGTWGVLELRSELLDAASRSLITNSRYSKQKGLNRGEQQKQLLTFIVEALCNLVGREPWSSVSTELLLWDICNNLSRCRE